MTVSFVNRDGLVMARNAFQYCGAFWAGGLSIENYFIWVSSLHIVHQSLMEDSEGVPKR